MKFLFSTFISILLLSCGNKDGFISDGVGGQAGVEGCPNVAYPDWETSTFVLPYPVGQTYTIGLSHCGGTPHDVGAPDQFAIDILMPVGTLVTSCSKGTIMFVEESGGNDSPVNNMVIIRDEDGYFLQYQHLTTNGALVEVGDFVEKGDPIGLSGTSGGALAPALHFVATRFGDWEFPYSRSWPITFANTKANPKSLIQNQQYTALFYEPDEE